MQFKTFQHVLFIGALTGVSVIFLWVLAPYFYPVFWAAVLAIVFNPLQRFWLKRTKERMTLATLLTMLCIVLAVLIPLGLLSTAVVKESINVYQNVTSDPAFFEKSLDNLTDNAVIGKQLINAGIDKELIAEKISENAKSIIGYVITHAAAVGQGAIKFIVNFFIMLYVLYYFLKYGRFLVDKLIRLLPIGDKKEKHLFEKFASTTRATIKGTLVIGIIQGILGGLLFWIVGINAPVIWGAVMAVFSILPAVGPMLVWAPTGIILLATGNAWQGILVLIFGALVIGTIDNILRPPLVGKDTEMPDVFILLSTLGGLTVFGISGFVIGPIIAAFFLAMWHMFEEEYQGDLIENNPQ